MLFEDPDKIFQKEIVLPAEAFDLVVFFGFLPVEGYQQAVRPMLCDNRFEIVEFAQNGITLQFLADFHHVVIDETERCQVQAVVAQHFAQQNFTALGLQ